MITVNEETVNAVLKKISNDEELTQEDKIILRNNPNPVNVSLAPSLILRKRSNYTPTTMSDPDDLGVWNANIASNNPSETQKNINAKLLEFMQAINNLHQEEHRNYAVLLRSRQKSWIWWSGL